MNGESDWQVDWSSQWCCSMESMCKWLARVSTSMSAPVRRGIATRLLKSHQPPVSCDSCQPTDVQLSVTQMASGQ